MADVFTKAKRSEVMSLIRSRGNRGTEVVLAKLLRRHKIIGWRRHLLVRVATGVDSSELMVDRRGRGKVDGRKRKPQKIERGTRRTNNYQPSTKTYQLTVRPDFVFTKSRLAVFVDGCFWHGCPKHGTQPKGNRAFWKQKFATNIARDRRVNRALKAADWRVVRIWECALKKRPLDCVERVRQRL